MSDTEREAIEAGNVWWEKELFCGRPEWQSLLKLNLPSLSAEEKDFLNNEVETLCTMLDDWDIVSKRHDLSKQVWDYLKSERFLGMIIPKKYGGKQFSASLHPDYSLLHSGYQKSLSLPLQLYILAIRVALLH